MSQMKIIPLFLLVACGKTSFNGQSTETTAVGVVAKNENQVSKVAETTADVTKEKNPIALKVDENKVTVTEPDLYGNLKYLLDANAKDGVDVQAASNRTSVSSWKNQVSAIAHAVQGDTSYLPSLMTEGSLLKYIDFNRALTQDLSIANSSDFHALFEPGKKWTIQFWMKPHAAPTPGWIVLFDKPFPQHIEPYYQLQIDYHPDTGEIRPLIVCEKTCSDLSKPISQTKWSHIAWTVDLANSHFKLYVNGQLARENDAPLTGTYKNYDTGAAIGGMLGHRTPVYNYDGQMLNFQIFDEALSAERVLKIYNSEKEKFSIVN